MRTGSTIGRDPEGLRNVLAPWSLVAGRWSLVAGR